MRRAACLLLALLAAGPALAQLGRESYHARRDQVDAEYDAALARCKPLQDHARDLCKVQARGVREVARAELDLQYKPGPDNEEKLRMVRADAVQAVAREKCDALVERQARDVCRKDAKAAWAAARAEAKMQKEAAQAGLRADKAARHHRSAAEERQLDAQAAAARERCDMMQPGATRDACLEDARQRFGRI